MKRVVMFTPGLSETGGAAQRSARLAQALQRRGWDVRVIARAGTLRDLRRRQARGLEVVEVPGFGRPRLGGLSYLALAVPLGVLWGWRASAFVAIQVSAPSLAAGICALITGRPYLALSTSHGQVSEVAEMLRRPSAPFRRWLFARASALVAQSEVGARELRRLAPRARVEVLPNPVDLPSEVPPLAGNAHVAFLGRLSREKDLLRLLDAWPAVLEERPEARLTIVGDGGAYRSVEDEVRRRVAADADLFRTVTLTGWVEDASRFLREADVFVLPSTSEGMSNSLLEACAWGRVVVASDIPANVAVLGADHPLLFPVGDTHGMARALVRALTDETARRQAVDSVAGRIEGHGTERVGAALEELIRGADRARD